MKLLIYIMIFLGAVLMIYNIMRYWRFTQRMSWLQRSKRDKTELYIPLVLLVLFLAGYLFVGILGEPDLVIAGILLGGSLFVMLIMRLLHFIVDRVNRDEQLQAALEEAQRASMAKSTFLSNMSHDIRTPMNAIIGYTQLADREGVSEQQMKQFIRKINASGQYLLALINDVLEMSRIESGKMELENAVTDLVCVMDNIRDIFSEQMEKKQITYTVRTQNLEERLVLCDCHRLNRVLMNLISNACKFTQEGGTVSAELSQSGYSDGNGIYEIRVKDNGIGMSQEFAGRIFDAFERERPSTDSGIQGTGLGMTITKNIVDLMGGSISIETEPGKGTEFLLRFAFAPAPGGEVPEKCTGPDSAGNHYEELAGLRILLAEDNEINREIAVMILQEKGILPDLAENGAAAVEMVREAEAGRYAAVLMDIQMPVMNGYDASRAIRAMEDPEKASLPIIAMTANAFREDIRLEQEAGMNAHVAKPVEVEELFRVLMSEARF